MELTTKDLEDALADPQHLGYGYATAGNLRRSQATALDNAVVRVANELDLDPVAFFDWTNSKYGRWLVDGVEGCGEKPNAETVRKYMNADTMTVLDGARVGF